MNPKIEVVRRRCDRLTELEYLCCYRNNFGRKGEMQESLVDCVRDKSYAYMARVDGDFAGWALFELDCSAIHPYNRAMFFVLADYRRMGVGTKLGKRIIKDFGVFRTRGWDERSDGFFVSLGVWMHRF